jgi:hypothetical protein
VTKNDRAEPPRSLTLLQQFSAAERVRDFIGTKPEFYDFQGMFSIHTSPAACQPRKP